ncbi:MAG TPA: hypothetical protein VIZ43_08585 [Trebonia sp.]
MKPWELLLRRTWALIRDVASAGFGLYLIYRETLHPGRNALEVLGIGFALTAPAAYEHVRAVLPGSARAGSAAPSSPESSQPAGSPESSAAAPGASGEPGG